MRARLHHLALGTRDVERLADFYRAAFELVELERHFASDGSLRSVWLDLGGSVLMIERTEASARRVEGVGAGPFLIAFRVAPEQREATEARLSAQGSPVEARSAASSYARDPDGNRVAISHYPQAAVARHDA